MTTDFVDESGAVRLRGQLVPSPVAAPVQGVYDGIPTSIPDNASAFLPCSFLNSGVDLLNRANPYEPTFRVAGTYAITLTFFSTAPLTAGGFVIAQFGTPILLGSSPSDSVTNTDSGSITSLTVKVGAGDPLYITVTNKDGVSARDFYIHPLVVVKLG